MSWITVAAGVSLGGTILGAGIGAAGANTAAKGKVAQDQSMARMAEYQAAVARNNAIIAGRNADYSVQVGQIKSDQQSYRTAQTIGAQKAQFAANGVDVNSGTPVDIRASTAELGRLDQLTVLNDAANKAAGYRAQAANFESEAQLDVMKQAGYSDAAHYDRVAGDYAVAGSLVGGATSFSDKWLGYSQKGVFG